MEFPTSPVSAASGKPAGEPNMPIIVVSDVSDAAHVGGAANGAFGAVPIGSSAVDDRERSFADDPAAGFVRGADVLSDAGVTRVIFVGSAAGEPRPGVPPGFAFVRTDGRPPAEIAGEVADLERARTPPGRRSPGWRHR